MQADLEAFEGDVRDANILAQITKIVDVVFHHAAIASVGRSMANPILEPEVNLRGTLHLLQAASKDSVRQLVSPALSLLMDTTRHRPRTSR